MVSQTLTVPSADPVANRVASELGMRGDTDKERIGEGGVCARVSCRMNVRKGILGVGSAKKAAASVVENG